MVTVRKISRSGVLFVLPAVLVILLVMLYPLVYTLVMGFFRHTLQMRVPVFAGFGQFRKLFADEIFIKSIGNTLAWALGSVSFQFIVGFSLAMLLHQPFVKYKALIRMFLMVPWVLPSIIGSAVWKWMYNADYGIINYLFKSLHLIETYRTWLSNPKFSMAAVVAVNVWKMFPFVLIMIEAALQGVSKDLKEAALVDGANKIRIFGAVTWPAVAPACYSVLLLLMIWTLNAFTFIYNLTMGGPAHSTGELNFGMASAASAVLFLISVLISIVYFRITSKDGED